MITEYEYLNATQKIHPGVRDEIAAYIDIDYEGPLSKQGKRVFQNVKKKGDKQYKLYTILNGKKILIWDPVNLDSSGNTSTSGVDYTYDGERAAISVQKSGAEISTTYIIDTRTGKMLYSPLQNTFGFSWTKDQQHAYFTIRSQEDVNKQLPLKTYRWEVGDSCQTAEFMGTTTQMQKTVTSFMTTVIVMLAFTVKAIFIPTNVICEKPALTIKEFNL